MHFQQFNLQILFFAISKILHCMVIPRDFWKALNFSEAYKNSFLHLFINFESRKIYVVSFVSSSLKISIIQSIAK